VRRTEAARAHSASPAHHMGPGGQGPWRPGGPVPFSTMRPRCRVAGRTTNTTGDGLPGFRRRTRLAKRTYDPDPARIWPGRPRAARPWPPVDGGEPSFAWLLRGREIRPAGQGHFGGDGPFPPSGCPGSGPAQGVPRACPPHPWGHRHRYYDPRRSSPPCPVPVGDGGEWAAGKFHARVGRSGAPELAGRSHPPGRPELPVRRAGRCPRRPGLPRPAASHHPRGGGFADAPGRFRNPFFRGSAIFGYGVTRNRPSARPATVRPVSPDSTSLARKRVRQHGTIAAVRPDDPAYHHPVSPPSCALEATIDPSRSEILAS